MLSFHNLLTEPGKGLQSHRPCQISFGSRSRTTSAEYQHATCHQQVGLWFVRFDKSMLTLKRFEHQGDESFCVGWTLQCGLRCRGLFSDWWGGTATLTGGTSQKNNERCQCNSRPLEWLFMVYDQRSVKAVKGKWRPLEEEQIWNTRFGSCTHTKNWDPYLHYHLHLNKDQWRAWRLIGHFEMWQLAQ